MVERMRRSIYRSRVTEMARNLRHLYATETTKGDIALGSPWYDDAHDIIREWSKAYGYSIATCAAVTAAISPQCEWTRNLIIADEILAGQPAPSIGGALLANIAKAKALRDADESDTRKVFKSGPKVYAFSRNLMGDLTPVTVDTHATQAALGDVEITLGLNAAKYEAFATAYERAALSLGYQPAIFQAIIWHTWKRMYPRVAKIQRRTQWEAIGEY